MTSLLSRFQQRKVVQWALAYAAAAWLILQVLQLLSDTYTWPPVLTRVAPVVLVTGLLVVLVLAWFHGERGAQRYTLTELGLIAVILLLGGVASTVVARRSPPAPRAFADAGIAQASVAVLPFVNMSGNPENEYFSDGITEEILNKLARVPGVHVAARTSSFAFKGKSEDIAEIGRKLRVRHIIEGSVQRANNRARITVQLINAKDGYHIWSERYDRDLSDIFAVEDEIAAAVARNLEKHFSPGGHTHGTPVSEAHDLYLLGLQSWGRRNLNNVRQAISYFERAIAADSTYPQAHAGLALGLAVLPLYDPNLEADATRTKATLGRGKTAARTALRLNPELAEAHAALGTIADYENDQATAERELRAAIRINPNYATAHQWLAEALQHAGRYDEALAEARRAVLLDPLSAVTNAALGKVTMTTPDLDGVIQAFSRSMQLDSQFVFTNRDLGFISLENRRFDVARKALRSHFRQVGIDTTMVDLLIGAVESGHDKPAVLAFLESDTNQAKLRGFEVVLYKLIGEDTRALERARELAVATRANEYRRFNMLSHLRLFRSYRELSGDPRFPASMR